MTDRQTKAVAKALWGYLGLETENNDDYLSCVPEAKAAIAASDAQYVKPLVEALRKIATNDFKMDGWMEREDMVKLAKQALANLPEDLR